MQPKDLNILIISPFIVGRLLNLPVNQEANYHWRSKKNVPTRAISDENN